MSKRKHKAFNPLKLRVPMLWTRPMQRRFSYTSFQRTSLGAWLDAQALDPQDNGPDDLWGMGDDHGDQ